MLGGLRRILQGAKDQVNPFDGGKSWGNPQGKPAPKAPAKPVMPYGMKDMSTADTGIVGPTSNYPPIGPPSRAFGPAEDDLPVNTPNGRMPLSSVNPGQQWQNPDTGYSPTGYNAGTVDDSIQSLLRTLFRR